MASDLESLRQTFFTEAGELLTQLESGLLALADRRPDADAVNSLFRAAHTLKGSAGLFGLQSVVAFAHVVEGLLETLRNAPDSMTEAHRKLLLSGHDELARMLELCGRGETPTADAALLVAFGGHGPAGAAPKKEAAAAAGPVSRWKLSIKLAASVLRDGMDPLTFLRYLQRLGTVEQLVTDFSALPTGDSFDPESSYLSFALELSTAAAKETIEEVFEFVREGSEISVEKVTKPVAVAEAEPVVAAPAAAVVQQLKVSAPRLDGLVDLIGELVLASATAHVAAQRSKDAATGEALAAVDALVAQLRDAALGLRMVPIGDTFARFHRVVREVSQKLGKDVELELKGGDTELDKAMVEQLFDPLLHIVRNALDHGVEGPEVRKAQGKSPKGKLTLEASHDAGQVLIRISDDGGGLKRERLLSIARKKGLIAANAQLTDAEIVDLIFLPGFSSAEAVTELSGRGVGMDVVRRAVTKLRDSIDVQSTEGEGTTLRMRLPLTLAIIDGFLVEAGGCPWVLPLKQVTECLSLGDVLESELHQRLDVRGELVPFLRLRDVYQLDGPKPSRESVLLVQHGEQRVGVVVDRLIGAWQTVIKPLGKIFQQLEGVGGSTVLGTGEVAFIIDVPRLVQLAMKPRLRAVA